MERYQLGQSKVTVPRIGMGCWAFGGGEYWGEQSQKDVDEVVSAALSTGINFFDTAEMYNNGESEVSLGKALKGRREKAVICTKISPSNCRNVREHLLASMERLQTDYIDIYMMHWPINTLAVKHFTDSSSVLADMPTIQETCDQLKALKKEGLIRAVGISNFGVKQMEEFCGAGLQADVNEMPYNIVSRAIEAGIVPCSEKLGISIIGSMGLQQGLLAGIYKDISQIPSHQAHSRHFADFRGQGTSRHGEAGAEREMAEVLKVLERISADMGIPMAQLSLAWIFSKPFMKSVLVGSRNVAQLESNIQATNVVLPKEVEAEINRISLPVLEKLGNNPDYYENSASSRIF